MSLQNIDGSYNVTLEATTNTAGSFPVPTPLTCYPLANASQLAVGMEPNQIFWEDWGTGTLDTTNKWNAANLSTGTSTTTVGSEVLASTTTTSAWAFLQSQYQFPGRNPGYNYAQLQIQVEASPVVTNAYRFWGFATIPGTPTAALPLTNAVGFEIGITGKMFAVTFASGTRTPIKDLSSTGSNVQPLDGATHKYVIYFRGDNILWYIDNTLVAQTLTGATGPDVNTLNLSFLTVANTVAPSATATVTIAQATVGDTSRNAQGIVDGTFNWRSATVSSAGGLITGGYKYSHLTTTGGTTLKTGAGILHSVTCNTTGTLTVTLADATSGTTPAIAIITNPVQGQVFVFDAAFNTGLTVTLSATSGDLTVTYI